MENSAAKFYKVIAMKRKIIMIVAAVCILAVSAVVLILLYFFNKKNDDVNVDLKNISLVYRYGNYAYGRKDELYTIERDGTIRCHDMRNENKNTTLIATVIALLQDQNSIFGTSDEIPEDIIEAVKQQNLGELKYSSESGAIDAPYTVYYVLVETDTSIELIDIASYGGINKISDFKLREETVDYINSVIKSVK